MMMHGNEEEMNRLVTNIWTSVRSFEFTLVPAVDTIPESQRSMADCTRIAGQWQGTVTLFCPDPPVRRAAASMFGMAADEVSAMEMQAALRELISMAAGNINTLLPPGCCISLPPVAEGMDCRITVPGGKITCQLRTDQRLPSRQ